MVRAFLGLGSNLGDREEYLRWAVGELAAHGLVAVSPVYETAPVGGPDQDPFLNIVVELATGLTARRLMEIGQELEAGAERVREIRWGPRTLDVDVLWIDGVTIDEPDLRVPHPRLWERRFVLAPLRDLAPELVTAEQVEAATGEVQVRGTLTAEGP